MRGLGNNGVGPTTCGHHHNINLSACPLCTEIEAARLAVLAGKEKINREHRQAAWEKLPLLGTTHHEEIENFDGESGESHWLPIPAFCRLYPFPFRVRGDRASNDPSSPDLNLR